MKEESEKIGLKINIQKTKIVVSGPITSRKIDGETVETVADCIFGGSKITSAGDFSHEIKRHLLLWRKAMTNLDSILKSRDITLPSQPSQSYGFSSSHVWIWELDYKESWALKYWFFWTVVLEKTHESPLGFKEIQPVHPKGNQSWIFIERTDAEAETPKFDHLIGRSGSLEKTLILGKIEHWRKMRWQRMMVGWHHGCSEYEFEQTPGIYWRTGKRVILQSMGSQRFVHTLATKQQQQNTFKHCFNCFEFVWKPNKSQNIWIFVKYLNICHSHSHSQFLGSIPKKTSDY